MSKGNFSVGNWAVRHDISVEEVKISGRGGPEFPCLSIPVDIILRPLEREPKIKACTILWIKSNLQIGDKKIGEGISEPMEEYSWPDPSPRNFLIEIPLDLYRIEKIEEQRNGDIQFRLLGSMLIAVHPSITRVGPDERQEYNRCVEQFAIGRIDIALNIPQSHWVDKILSNLGYGKVKLIEIPIPEKIVPDIFQKALNELQESKKYFIDGDYDKVVAHCRNAIQLIPEVLPIDLPSTENSSFNNRVKIFFKQHLSNLLTDEKREAFQNIIKEIWSLSSIIHHPSPPDYFNRADAEAILQITTTLLAYVGKLLKKKEER
jgi:hypothetical protein